MLDTSLTHDLTIFPLSGQDMASEMRRITVVCEVKDVAGAIWAWGTGAAKSNTLNAAINYHGDFRMRSPEVVLAILDFIASFVSGGLDADLAAIPETDLRDMMRLCRESASEIEVRIRARMKVAA